MAHYLGAVMLILAYGASIVYLKRHVLPPKGRPVRGDYHDEERS